jgi:hypothetical protein
MRHGNRLLLERSGLWSALSFSQLGSFADEGRVTARDSLMGN